ncbi:MULTISPECIES: anthranilate phosphoribosyltransferase family protein [Trichocoleus]|uniref:Anthranilate phosphoribosyltransferase family protein n=1 Tax=Trichocoleus desertorum GB2-A4 TaxID=2933944 RepID=A0ABV0JCU0_9CYAN|nr:anthranilate phosphoribosyltransferase family protein [Trichocoleus sp. FACHB-46]MBD1863116.1 anthranilate phosphoribosyltransferase family protein [Trichocoleus sp. FACHB-46]
MSDAFRELLRKVGSGPHTGKNLNRSEAAAATRMMLLQEATPAQIGAFMIAHRIKRPTGEELAGMLDAYAELGPQLQPIGSEQAVLVLSSPYDGRSRTAPISPLTALIVAAAGYPVIMHGGDRMPTKQGLPLVEVWQGLGIDWTRLTLEQVQQVLATTQLGFVYLPQHFPQAHGLVPYRDQIGKRPPFATLELLWGPYAGSANIVSGFVHPPTEVMLQDAFQLRGFPAYFTTVKGLEGSCDLPRDRTAIIGLGQGGADFFLERLLLAPRDYDFAGIDVPLEETTQLIAEMQAVLQGDGSELGRSAIWNGGFYLWRCGACADLATGLTQAEALLTQGQAAAQLQKVQQAIAGLASDLQDHAFTG